MTERNGRMMTDWGWSVLAPGMRWKFEKKGSLLGSQLVVGPLRLLRSSSGP